MNQHTSNEHESNRHDACAQQSIERYLRGLPTALPPAGLGVRIIARHRARRRHRRQGWAAAAAAVLALAMLRPGPPLPADTPAGQPAAAIDVLAVRALDRQLQLAYAAGGDSGERERLWQLREAALRAGERADTASSRLVRL